MLLIFLALCSLGNRAVLAKPPPAALSDALAAAAISCPVSATETCENTQLADDLQSATTGPVLTCSNASRSAFLDAIVLPQPSGYPGDTNDVPTVVIQPVDVADVEQAVKIAAAHNITVAVKGGGWSWRNSWRADGGLTVDLSSMKAVTVDAERRQITAQGGAIYADILEATEPYNLAVPWGDATQTGMGLALGGGIGYLLRPHGLTADSIIDATLVLANGTQVTASSTKNADLLAAMRGGGTLFGVVTEVTFKAYDISDYHGGVITYEDDTNCTALRAAHDWAVEAMTQESSLGVEVIGTNFAGPGQNLVQVQVGMPGSVPDKVRQDIIAPLQDLPNILEDSLDTLNYTAHEQLVTAVGDGLIYRSQYFISAVLTFQQAEDGLLDLLPQLIHDVPPNFAYLYLADYLGNTVSDNAVKNTSSFTGFGGNVDFHFFIKYEWPAGVNDAANSAFCQERIDMMAPYVTSTQPYFNLATVVNNATLEYQVGGASKLAELRQLKKQLDPDNMFRRHGLVGL